MLRKRPTSDRARLEQLQTITAHPELTTRNGDRLISEQDLQQTQQIAEQLEEAIQNRNRAQTEWIAANAERNKEVETLRRIVRAAWTSLHGMVGMGDLTEIDFNRFGLSIRGRRPEPRTARAWMKAAQPFIEADNPQIGNLDRERLKRRVEATVNATLEAENAEATLRKQQGELKRIRGQADRWLAQTAMNVKARLYEEDETTRRRTMRTLGYRFRDNRETEPEPEPA